MERYQTMCSLHNFMQPQKRNQWHLTSHVSHHPSPTSSSFPRTTQLSSHIVRDQSHRSFKLSLSINIFLIFPTNKHHEMRQQPELSLSWRCCSEKYGDRSPTAPSRLRRCRRHRIVTEFSCHRRCRRQGRSISYRRIY